VPLHILNSLSHRAIVRVLPNAVSRTLAWVLVVSDSKGRIVYFATHGLVAGDIKGLAEPSLALSIPAQSSDFDDHRE